MLLAVQQCCIALQHATQRLHAVDAQASPRAEQRWFPSGAPEGVEAVAVRYNLQILNRLHSSDVCSKGNNNGDGAALSYGLHVSVLQLS